MKRRILVLGASGFIGRRVVAALAARGDLTPVAAGRRHQPVDAFGGAGVETVRLDVTDPAGWPEALTGVDGIVNCAAGDPRTIVTGAATLFRQVAATRPAIVHFSSMAVYGSATGLVDETAPLAGDAGAYAAAKVEAERLAAAYPRAIILRPGCVYGPGSPQWSERIASWLIARRIGDLGADGDGCSNLVHVDDVVAATLRALDLPAAEGRAYNLAMAAAPRWNDYFLLFARALAAVPIVRLPAWRLKAETRLLAPPLKIAEILARRIGIPGAAVPPPIPPSLVRLWRQDIRLVGARAERELGLSWTGLEAGLAATAAAFRARSGAG